MDKNTKRIRLFNKTLLDFIRDLKTSGQNIPFKKVKDYKDLETFKEQVKLVEDNFIKCEKSCIESIIFLKNLNVNLVKYPEPSFWRFAHNLYFTVVEDPETLLKTSKDCIDILMKSNIKTPQINVSDFKEFMSSNTFQNMVSSVSSSISSQLNGKDLSSIDPNTLMTDLMMSIMGTPSSSQSGINFNKIIEDVKEVIETEASSGSLDGIVELPNDK